MLIIGSLPLRSRFLMAPMAGITHLPFRLLVKRLGAGLVTTEMVSAVGLVRNQAGTFQYLRTHLEEAPLCVQIFGARPDDMARAAEIAVQSGAGLVDINMGCPVKKVVKTGAGAALLRNPSFAAEIVSAVRKSCPVPLTVKIRAGWSPDRPMALELSRIFEDCGVDALTIHPRFATQGFSGKADWSLIALVKSRLGIPVIGNGDVFSPFLALEMLRQTGCDAVMIGRGAVTNPWIFSQIPDLEQGAPVWHPGLKERRDLILEHFRLLCLMEGEEKASRAMRGLLFRYTKGLPHSGQFRSRFGRILDPPSLVSALDDFFSLLDSRAEQDPSGSEALSLQNPCSITTNAGEA